MPFKWTHSPISADEEIRLWPHRSLPPKGFAAFVLGTFTLITLPLFPLLGTKLLWGLLPFLMAAVGGIWWALDRSYKDGNILETLTINGSDVCLHRQNPKGPAQTWTCNAYWVRVELHPKAGPVPNYVTLAGNGREVEIGAFLSEDERKALYDDMKRLFDRLTQPQTP